jgi:uncharacterized membrane protein
VIVVGMIGVVVVGYKRGLRVLRVYIGIVIMVIGFRLISSSHVAVAVSVVIVVIIAAVEVIVVVVTHREGASSVYV